MEPTLDIPAFRAQFPEFKDNMAFPDAVITQYWEWAKCYITPCAWPYMPLGCLQLALYQMVAHLLKQSTIIAKNQTPSVVNGATIDKVSVTLQAVPALDQWQLWLSTTSYGAQLLALLQAKAAGGFFVGGAPESLAYRRVGGAFF